MRMRVVAATLLLAVLAGCTTPGFTRPPGHKEFRAGFAAGCDAGYAVAGSPFYRYRSKAEPPPKGDPQRVGWLAGYDRCKRNYERMQWTVHSILGPP